MHRPTLSYGSATSVRPSAPYFTPCSSGIKTAVGSATRSGGASTAPTVRISKRSLLRQLRSRLRPSALSGATAAAQFLSAF